MKRLLTNGWLRVIAILLLCLSVSAAVWSGAGCYESFELADENTFAESHLASSVAFSIYDEVLGALSFSYRSEEWLTDIGSWAEITVTEYNDNGDEVIIFDSHADDSLVVYISDYSFFQPQDLVDGEYYPSTEPAVNGRITIYAPSEIDKNSRFYCHYCVFDLIKDLQDDLLPLTLIISTVISLLLVVYLLCAAGHTKDGLKAVRLDRLPLDFCIAAAIGIIGLLLVCIFDANLFNIYSGIRVWVFNFAFVTLIFFAITIIGILTLMTIAARFKIGKWWVNTISYRVIMIFLKVLHRFIERLRSIFTVIPFFWKGILLICAFLFLNAVLWISTADGNFLSFLLNLALNIGGILLAIRIVENIKRIKEYSENLSDGKFEQAFDTEKMLPDFKKIVENLNGTQRGLSLAVNDKLKSEKFKTELITNVSHDLKTPLTSIINYVDLLGNEKIDNPTANEYIDILKRQANKLKKLTVDLVDAAKASSGAVTVELSKLNVYELLSQCIGEFSEKFEQANINVVLNADSSTCILADGRLLSRVLDNLINNTIKYALSGTRAYFDVISTGGKIHILIKNISRDQLNISSEELFERFVRGDSSRSTEGSGLGLSIARSLTELMGGTLDITLDGDLFKVELVFPEA